MRLSTTLCALAYTPSAFVVVNADSCPLVRFGIMSPTITYLKILACVFSAYHAVKGQVRGDLIDMQENSGTRIIKLWSVFAQSLAAEAGERDIQFASFSLPKSVDFLSRGCFHRPVDHLDILHAPPIHNSAVHEDSH